MNVQTFMLGVLPEAGSTMNIVLFNSLVILVGASFLAMLLKWLPIRSPAINQSLWFLVLLAGVVLFRVPVDVPSPFSTTSHSDGAAFQLSSQNEKFATAAVDDGLHDHMPAVRADGKSLRAVDSFQNVELANGPAASRQRFERLSQLAQADVVASVSSEIEHSTPHPDSQPGSQKSRVLSERGSAVSLPLQISARLVDTPQTTSHGWSRNSSRVNHTLFLVWISGGLLIVLCSVVRLWMFRRFISRDEMLPADSEATQWADEWNAVCADSEVRRIPRLCFTKSVGPGLCPGITRPCLILPVPLWQKLEVPQRKAVLRHEAAHLVRRDLWKSLLVRLLALPHWFNPFAWLAVRRFEEASEWACDEAATNSSIETGCQFAELLISLTKKNDFRPVVAGQSLATNKSLKERITRLVQSDEPQHRSLWRTAIVLTVPFFLLAASVIDVRLVAQSEVSSTGATTAASRASRTSPNDHHPADGDSPHSKENADQAAPAKPNAGDTPPSADDATGETTDEPAAASTSPATKRPPDPIPSLPGFEFSPWYELDDNRLWQHIGWKVGLTHHPEDIDAFVTLMQTPRFQNDALDLNSHVIASLGINRLKELPNIEAINLGGGLPVTQQQLNSIAELPNLRRLDLTGLQITTDQLAYLAGARKLQSLNLQRTQITTRALKFIGDHSSLEELYLGHVRLTAWDRKRDPDSRRLNVPLRHLSPLKKLRRLQISTSEAGNLEGLEFLPALETLQLLQGFKTLTLADSDFESLSRLSRLHHLQLPHPPDAKQIESLRPLTRLRTLSFPDYDKNIQQTYAEVRSRLPNVRVGANYHPNLDDQTVVNFADTPLSACLNYLSRQHALPIFIDEPSFEEFGYRTNEPINLVLRGTTLRSALRLMLSDLELRAVPHQNGLTVTPIEGNRLYADDYDLSEVLRGVEAGDNLTARLAVTLQKLITPEIWGQEFPKLPIGDSAEAETRIAAIRSVGTTLTVLAPPMSHLRIDQFVRQIIRGENSTLVDVELRQMIDRHLPNPPPGYKPNAALFVDVPLTDCVEYIQRTYNCPIIIDVVGIEEAGMLVDEPVTRDFELTTLEDCLDRILTPLKLTWIYEDEVIKVVHRATDAERPKLIVHQLTDDFLEPQHPLEKEDWRLRLKTISYSAGIKSPRYEVWFNRLIVYEPWRAQYRLSRKLDEMLYQPNRIRRQRYSAEDAD